MKTYIRHLVVVSIIFASTHAGCVKAQRVIDTNYYRYVSTPFAHEHWEYAYQVDEEGHRYVIDSVSMCTKDKLGFIDVWNYEFRLFCHQALNYSWLYWTLPLPRDNMDIYGIAVFLDSVRFFHSGDYLKMYVCKKSEDGATFPIEKLDSVVLDENTMGVRRYMIHPFARSVWHLWHPEYEYDSINHTYYPIPYEDCMDYDTLVPVVEVYFDQPVHIRDSQLFWYFECAASDSTFIFKCRLPCAGEVTSGNFINSDGPWTGWGWDVMMAITEPLPQWEQDSMEVLITDVIYDPDDPDDPQDPDDPDNPGGDEGIGAVDGGLQSAVSLRPNPSSGVTTVSCEEAITELTVRDMAGRVVVHRTACGTTATFDTSTFRKGVYLVKVTTTRGTATKKLVVEL